MNKKKIIIISLSILIVIAVALVMLLPDKKVTIYNDNIVDTYEPEFMNMDEKSKSGLSEDSKIQVLKRGDEGGVEIYKIIREEGDIEYNLETISEVNNIRQ